MNLFILAFVGVSAALLVALVVDMIAERRKKRTFLASAARRLGGEEVRGDLLSSSRIEFPVGGRTASVEFITEGDLHGRTRVCMPLWGASPGTLHIIPEGFGQDFLKLFGAQDIVIGNPDFDRAYVVKASPEALAARVFGPDRRERVIAAVQRLARNDRPTIEVTRNQLRILVCEEIRDVGRLMQVVKTAEEFLEFLHPESPVKGVDLGEVKVAADSLCPVCGTGLGRLPVRCESCRTPHHAECWKYVGQCSTYACKGRRWGA